jgi:hypothetical protein
LAINSVSGTITPVGGSAQSFSSTISGTTASYSNSQAYALNIYKGLTSPLSVTLSSAEFPNVSSSLSRDGLVDEYLFGGSASDTAGSDNGTLVGNVTSVTDRFGNANSAYKFAGGTADYVQLANSSTLDFPCTLSAWVNYSSIASYWSWVFETDAWNNYAGTYRGIVVGLNPSPYFFAGWGSSTNPYSVGVTNSFIPSPNVCILLLRLA